VGVWARIRLGCVVSLCAGALSIGAHAKGEESPKPAPPVSGAPASGAPASDANVHHFDILEYVVDGNTVLSVPEIEEAVYPFLGESRTADDVDRARKALEDL
jgi:hemolysin activation/secretion protein